MKNINKIIHWKIVEITLLISIIIVSFPIWKTLEKNEVLSIASSYSNVQFSHLEVSNYALGSMFPISNEQALKNIEPTSIKVINDTKTTEDYSLYIKVSKNSTLDYNCLNIALNNKIAALNEFILSEDEENYYFLLESNTIAGEIKEYSFMLWMDEKTDNSMQGKTLTYSFEIQKQIAI